MIPFIQSNVIPTENVTNENVENDTNETESTIVINAPKKRGRLKKEINILDIREKMKRGP